MQRCLSADVQALTTLTSEAAATKSQARNTEDFAKWSLQRPEVNTAAAVHSMHRPRWLPTSQRNLLA